MKVALSPFVAPPRRVRDDSSRDPPSSRQRHENSSSSSAWSYGGRSPLAAAGGHRASTSTTAVTPAPSGSQKSRKGGEGGMPSRWSSRGTATSLVASSSHTAAADFVVVSGRRDGEKAFASPMTPTSARKNGSRALPPAIWSNNRQENSSGFRRSSTLGTDLREALARPAPPSLNPLVSLAKLRSRDSVGGGQSSVAAAPSLRRPSSWKEREVVNGGAVRRSETSGVPTTTSERRGVAQRPLQLLVGRRQTKGGGGTPGSSRHREFSDDRRQQQTTRVSRQPTRKGDNRAALFAAEDSRQLPLVNLSYMDGNYNTLTPRETRPAGLAIVSDADGVILGANGFRVSNARRAHGGESNSSSAAVAPSTFSRSLILKSSSSFPASGDVGRPAVNGGGGQRTYCTWQPPAKFSHQADGFTFSPRSPEAFNVGWVRGKVDGPGGVTEEEALRMAATASVSSSNIARGLWSPPASRTPSPPRQDDSVRSRVRRLLTSSQRGKGSPSHSTSSSQRYLNYQRQRHYGRNYPPAPSVRSSNRPSEMDGGEGSSQIGGTKFRPKSGSGSSRGRRKEGRSDARRSPRESRGGESLHTAPSVQQPLRWEITTGDLNNHSRRHKHNHSHNHNSDQPFGSVDLDISKEASGRGAVSRNGVGKTRWNGGRTAPDKGGVHDDARRTREFQPSRLFSDNFNNHEVAAEDERGPSAVEDISRGSDNAWKSQQQQREGSLMEGNDGGARHRWQAIGTPVVQQQPLVNQRPSATTMMATSNDRSFRELRHQNRDSLSEVSQTTATNATGCVQPSGSGISQQHFHQSSDSSQRGGGMLAAGDLSTFSPMPRSARSSATGGGAGNFGNLAKRCRASQGGRGAASGEEVSTTTGDDVSPSWSVSASGSTPLPAPQTSPPGPSELTRRVATSRQKAVKATREGRAAAGETTVRVSALAAAEDSTTAAAPKIETIEISSSAKDIRQTSGANDRSTPQAERSAFESSASGAEGDGRMVGEVEGGFDFEPQEQQRDDKDSTIFDDRGSGAARNDTVGDTNTKAPASAHQEGEDDGDEQMDDTAAGDTETHGESDNGGAAGSPGTGENGTAGEGSKTEDECERLDVAVAENHAERPRRLRMQHQHHPHDVNTGVSVEGQPKQGGEETVNAPHPLQRLRSSSAASAAGGAGGDDQSSLFGGAGTEEFVARRDRASRKAAQQKERAMGGGVQSATAAVRSVPPPLYGSNAEQRSSTADRALCIPVLLPSYGEPSPRAAGLNPTAGRRYRRSQKPKNAARSQKDPAGKIEGAEETAAQQLADHNAAQQFGDLRREPQDAEMNLNEFLPGKKKSTAAVATTTTAQQQVVDGTAAFQGEQPFGVVSADPPQEPAGDMTATDTHSSRTTVSRRQLLRSRQPQAAPAGSPGPAFRQPHVDLLPDTSSQLFSVDGPHPPRRLKTSHLAPRNHQNESTRPHHHRGPKDSQNKKSADRPVHNADNLSDTTYHPAAKAPLPEAALDTQEGGRGGPPQKAPAAAAATNEEGGGCAVLAAMEAAAAKAAAAGPTAPLSPFHFHGQETPRNPFWRPQNRDLMHPAHCLARRAPGGLSGALSAALHSIEVEKAAEPTSSSSSFSWNATTARGTHSGWPQASLTAAAMHRMAKLLAARCQPPAPTSFGGDSLTATAHRYTTLDCGLFLGASFATASKVPKLPLVAALEHHSDSAAATHSHYHQRQQHNMPLGSGSAVDAYFPAVASFDSRGGAPTSHYHHGGHGGLRSASVDPSVRRHQPIRIAASSSSGRSNSSSNFAGIRAISQTAALRSASQTTTAVTVASTGNRGGALPRSTTTSALQYVQHLSSGGTDTKFTSLDTSSLSTTRGGGAAFRAKPAALNLSSASVLPKHQQLYHASSDNAIAAAVGISNGAEHTVAPPSGAQPWLLAGTRRNGNVAPSSEDRNHGKSPLVSSGSSTTQTAGVSARKLPSTTTDGNSASRHHHHSYAPPSSMTLPSSTFAPQATTTGTKRTSSKQPHHHRKNHHHSNQTGGSSAAPSGSGLASAAAAGGGGRSRPGRRERRTGRARDPSADSEKLRRNSAIGGWKSSSAVVAGSQTLPPTAGERRRSPRGTAEGGERRRNHNRDHQYLHESRNGEFSSARQQLQDGALTMQQQSLDVHNFYAAAPPGAVIAQPVGIPSVLVGHPPHGASMLNSVRAVGGKMPFHRQHHHHYQEPFRQAHPPPSGSAGTYHAVVSSLATGPPGEHFMYFEPASIVVE